MPRGEECRAMCCVACGEVYAGSPTDDGDLVPNGAASGGRCHECGGDEFEQIMLDSST